MRREEGNSRNRFLLSLLKRNKMGKTAILAMCCFVIWSGLPAQQFSIGLRVNRLSDYTQEQAIPTDGTSSVQYKQLQRTRYHDIELFAIKPIGEKTSLVARLGLIYYVLDTEGTIPRGLRNYANFNAYHQSLGFRATTGLQREILNTANVAVSIGCNAFYQRMPEGLEQRQEYIHDENGVFQFRTEDETSVPAIESLGGALNLRLYYYFFDRVGLGLEIESRLSYQMQAGDAFFRRDNFDNNGNLSETTVWSRYRAESSISHFTFISIGAEYRFFEPSKNQSK